MRNLDFKNFVNTVSLGIRHNSPTILSGMAVAGLITTAVLAVKVTPKAMALISSEEARRLTNHEDPDLTAKEIISITWKLYVPAVVMGTVTIACIIGANSINLRRNAALASVYSITEATLKEYQAKVIETIGEKKERLIKDEIAQDKLTNNPVGNHDIIITGKGDTLCYDSLSGRYFKSDIEKLRKTENDVNFELIHNVWITLNEVYTKMGVDGINLGNDMGWNSDRMMEFEFSAKLTTEGTPCIVVEHRFPPSAKFRQ